MILVDTSVWVNHLRSSDGRLAAALADGRAGVHRFVIGELALGQLRRRGEILTLLRALPDAGEATHDEVHELVESHRLAGSGIGWIDAHLLCAARLAGWQLWTADRRLASVAARLDLSPDR
ncbi:MAG TPA: PIN domain-containing protein [Vicinamibacterales bacterium]|nr:PIN domain-containing protein [Vicinamibacterales bacterium]